MVNKSKMPRSAAFSPGLDESKSSTYSTTRNQVLEQVTTNIQKKEASKRVQGKIGIITGVGPETGIGVSLWPYFQSK